MCQSEKDLEIAFRDHVVMTNCFCLKLTCSALTGWPDRTILCPGGRTYFVELKRPDGKGRVSKRQLIVAEALQRLGFRVLITESLTEAVEHHDNFLAGTP